MKIGVLKGIPQASSTTQLMRNTMATMVIVQRENLFYLSLILLSNKIKLGTNGFGTVGIEGALAAARLAPHKTILLQQDTA